MKTPPLLPTAAMAFVLASLALPIATLGGTPLHWTHFAAPLVFACCALFAAFLATLRDPTGAGQAWLFNGLAGLAAVAPLMLLGAGLDDASGAEPQPWKSGFWCFLVALALVAVLGLRRVASLDARGAAGRLATPLLFGAWVLVFWELLTRSLGVPRVLLPAPSVVWAAGTGAFGVLAADFVQTVLHSVLIGLAIGAGLGFGVGLLIDRSAFLQRGLLPVAALASAVPLVGIAPIMVMWFGFDWHSKAAVVVVMTFFPMLVNTLAGLAVAGRMEQDLMRSYGASPWRTLRSLRIPVALPFVFNALKIDSTLALIGAIVAEFFGSPTEGLGFRISTEAARLNMGLVWAAIGVAALTGSLLYALVAFVERRATFWHPSVRTA